MKQFKQFFGNFTGIFSKNRHEVLKRSLNELCRNSKGNFSRILPYIFKQFNENFICFKNSSNNVSKTICNKCLSDFSQIFFQKFFKKKGFAIGIFSEKIHLAILLRISSRNCRSFSRTVIFKSVSRKFFRNLSRYPCSNFLNNCFRIFSMFCSMNLSKK